MFVLIDKIIHKYQKKQFLMPLVVTLHNIPEGMAVGVAIASLLQENILMTYASVFALSIGIAIQNIPEGAIISMALKSKGASKFKSFLIGVASGAVEPIATFITILFTNMISTILPYALALSAGAMLYVIIEELIPSAYKENSKLLIISFKIGFLIMMILDVMLG
jgi:ZIP family zinc transporter